MSYSNYKKALTLATKCNNYEIISNVQEKIIREAEDLLSITFSKQHYDFYKDIGILSFYGSEFYGMSNRELKGLPGSNAILLAMADRKEYNLNEKWVPIYFFDEGNMAYFNYNKLNEEGEPEIINAYYNGKDYIIVEKLADDLGDFLLQIVQEQLS